MPLINCKISLDLSWPKKCVIVASNTDQETTFSITDTNCSSCNVINSGKYKTT